MDEMLVVALQQAVELWFARTWIVIAALYVASLDAGAVYVFALGIQHWRKLLLAHEGRGFSGSMPDFNTTVLIASIVVAVLNVVILGLMNVGQSFFLVTEGAEPLSWLIGVTLFPLVTGKAITKFSSNKYGSTESPPPEVKP